MGKRRRRHFGHLKQRGTRPGWYVVFRHPEQEKPIERYAGPTKGLAEKKLAKIQALANEGRSLDKIKAAAFGDIHGSRLTFRDAVPLFLEYAKVLLKPSTHKTHGQRLGLLSRAPWAGGYLSNITPVAITRWTMDRMKDDGISIATVNRDLSVGSALYTWAVRMGHVKDNPFRRVVKEKEKGREKETYLTAQECWALQEDMPASKMPLVFAAIHSGMRRGELVALKWRAVNFDRQQILVEAKTEKTGRGRVVHLTGPLYALLADLKAARRRPHLDGSDPVFADASGNAIKAGTISRAVRVAARACKGIAAEKREKVTFHTLRHTAASLMVQNGVSLFDVGKSLGHKTPLVTLRYAHFAPEAGRAAADRLEEALLRGEPEHARGRERA